MMPRVTIKLECCLTCWATISCFNPQGSSEFLRYWRPCWNRTRSTSHNRSSSVAERHDQHGSLVVLSHRHCIARDAVTAVRTATMIGRGVGGADNWRVTYVEEEETRRSNEWVNNRCSACCRLQPCTTLLLMLCIPGAPRVTYSNCDFISVSLMQHFQITFSRNVTWS